MSATTSIHRLAFDCIHLLDYLYKTGADDGYLVQSQHKADRERVRTRLLKILLGRFFSGQSDRLLTDVRRIVQEAEPAARFPADAVMEYLRVRRGVTFSYKQLAGIVSETRYGDPAAFVILALLEPGLNTQHTTFHVDHLHPASSFTKSQLAEAGMDEQELEFALDHYNGLANLSLLPDSDNVAKSDLSLGEWLARHSNQSFARDLARLPEQDTALANFR